MGKEEQSTKHLVRYMVIIMEKKYLGTILPINFIQAKIKN